jgi:hypothetical protein
LNAFKELYFFNQSDGPLIIFYKTAFGPESTTIISFRYKISFNWFFLLPWGVVRDMDKAL